MAASFEHQDINPNTISGINAEEQSDIALRVSAHGNINSAGPKLLRCFVNYDSLVIVRPGNTIDVIV